MKINTLVWVLVLAVVAAGLYWIINRPPAEELPSARSLIVAMSEQNNSGETGAATLIETDGGIRVLLELDGASAGITQPAHIHLGSCASVGAVVYPLTFPTDGVSETELDVTLDEILAGLPLVVNVHKSVPESAVYVSCGDITG